MSDNIDVTPGSGKTVGAYDRAGKLVQRVSTADKNLSVYEATLTTGNTTAITPVTAGNAIRMHYVYAMTGPDQTVFPVIRVGFNDGAGGTTIASGKGKYRTYGVAKERVFEGAADERVIINLSATSSVAVTIHYEEFTP